MVARQSGELLKAGATLVVLVPHTKRTVVELFLNGNDVPMVSAGRTVRLQFEGWPALQFSGWPSVAVGTFGGRVLLVDATDDGLGKFRVLVEPDPDDEPWPSAQYLRQGVRANGWVLLDVVSLGYELWRQFNGFPPVVATAGAARRKAPATDGVKVNGGRSEAASDRGRGVACARLCWPAAPRRPRRHRSRVEHVLERRRPRIPAARRGAAGAGGGGQATPCRRGRLRSAAAGRRRPAAR